MRDKLYYNGSSSYCVLTAHSCRKIEVPVNSSFSLLDSYLYVYSPCIRTSGRNLTGKRVYEYELIRRGEL